MVYSIYTGHLKRALKEEGGTAKGGGFHSRSRFSTLCRNERERKILPHLTGWSMIFCGKLASHNIQLLLFMRSMVWVSTKLSNANRLYHKNGRNVPGTVSNLTGKISSVLSKRGRFLSSAISKKLNVFQYRWPKFSTNRFWFSVSVLCFYIRWSKWADLL